MRVLLRKDATGAEEDITPRLLHGQWEFCRFGGHLGGQFVLPLKEGQSWTYERDIVEVQGDDGRVWYRGLITETELRVESGKWVADVKCCGYFQQLDWIAFQAEYESQVLRTILEDIISTYIAPETDIASTIDCNFSTTAPTINRFTSDYDTGRQAIENLLAQGPDCFWGVWTDSSGTNKFFARLAPTSWGYDIHADGGKMRPQLVSVRHDHSNYATRFLLLGKQTIAGRYTRQKNTGMSPAIWYLFIYPTSDDTDADRVLDNVSDRMSRKRYEIVLNLTVDTPLEIEKNSPEVGRFRLRGFEGVEEAYDYYLHRALYTIRPDGKLSCSLVLGDAK